MTTRRTNGFTLIEMLTVLVIMGIVLAIGIPAFTNLMKSGGLSAASRQVSSTLSLARQYAITHRTRTRVVFPYYDTQGTPACVHTNRAPWYQSYAVLEYGSPTNFTYLSKWELLPLGVVFVSNPTTPPLASYPPSLDTLPRASMAFPTNYNAPFLPFPSDFATLAYIEFGPTGAASPPSSGSANSFTITEGHMTGDAVTPTSKSNNVLANAVSISVDSVVGRIQVTRP